MSFLDTANSILGGSGNLTNVQNSFNNNLYSRVNTLSRPYRFTYTMTIPNPPTTSGTGGFLDSIIGTAQNALSSLGAVGNEILNSFVPLDLNNSPQHLVTVLCKGTEFPKQEIESLDVNIMGRSIKVPKKTSHGESISIEVYSDESGIIRSAFHNWMTSLDPFYIGNTSSTTLDLSGKLNKSLLSSSEISQYTYSGTKTFSYEFVNMFPIEIGEIQLDAGGNGVSTFKVTFSYTYYNLKSSTALQSSMGGLASLSRVGEMVGQVSGLAKSGIVNTISSII